MTFSNVERKTLAGITLAVLATIIWSGNFIIARGIIHDIPPVTLAFYRWFSATLILLPFAWKYVRKDGKIVRKHIWILLLAAITGVSMFNTFVYIAGHYSTAINMALLGTCSSPIISVILARIFLRERIPLIRIIGMLVCIAGILFLLGQGQLETLLSFRFTRGDWWVLAAALSFAIYNTSVKKKPVNMHTMSFLFWIFFIGTMLLTPFYFSEWYRLGGFTINVSNIASILYLGLGASVICFLVWNKAIAILGSGRTALFGNLIPLFSSLEAVLWLDEKISYIHIVSFILVVTGLVIANSKK